MVHPNPRCRIRICSFTNCSFADLLFRSLNTSNASLAVLQHLGESYFCTNTNLPSPVSSLLAASYPFTILRGSSCTIWRGKKVSEKEFRRPHQHHLTSINAEIDHRDDEIVFVARELLDALPAKIGWGVLTPWQRSVPFWLAYPCDVSKFSVHFGPHR